MIPNTRKWKNANEGVHGRVVSAQIQETLFMLLFENETHLTNLSENIHIESITLMFIVLARVFMYS